MSGYLLDTNIISDIIRNPFGLAARRIETVDPKEVCTNIVVAAELRYGCAKKGSAKLRAKVEGVLETIPVLPLDVPVDGEHGGICAELEAAGQTIGLNDLIDGRSCLRARDDDIGHGQYTRVQSHPWSRCRKLAGRAMRIDMYRH
ncbi:PIN domain-containing protein [Acidithiobacillus sp.]|uniref:PIN domain-containing protein n=1 Tax=Acidithiobacillus sp. TaxID=1872118 RepID=UPI002608E064|nr:PIN domain-containing protein [Acidithiobacillus sp.]